MSDEDAQSILESPAGRSLKAMATYSAVGEETEVKAYVARFAEMVATSVTHASARAKLLASRARLVTAGDEAVTFVPELTLTFCPDCFTPFCQNHTCSGKLDVWKNPVPVMVMELPPVIVP